MYNKTDNDFTADNQIVSNTNKKLTQLVEINRALAQDLDVSRRLASELGRDRDELLLQIEELENEVQLLKGTERRNRNHDGIEEIRQELQQERKKCEQIRRQRDAMAADAETVVARADFVEERLRDLFTEYNQVVQERDALLDQLEQSQQAMEEIHYRLANSFDNDSQWYDVQ